MEVIKTEKVYILHVMYNNADGGNDRDYMFDYLNNEYGDTGYRVRRIGPVPEMVGVGMAIIEVLVGE